MLQLVGIDAVDICRFNNWQNYNYLKLSKIFTKQEIDYCLSNTIKSAERFAARFAAKEAFYKAVCKILTKKISFLLICRSIEVVNSEFGPEITLKLDSSYFKYRIESLNLSITHSNNTAFAVIIILFF